MQKQFDILNSICRIFFEANKKFDTLRYIYRFNPDEGWVETRLLIVVNGVRQSMNLNAESNNELKGFCQKLHAEMQTQTGGDWRKFILTINENSEVKTQFIYEIQSCMDEFKDK
ncbi:hypothetical protein [Pasteurella testudinis]|uniref:hypothetical protein n=1 Tax=Pasteurella testudinis TaxID=761 RepID=UPI004059865F